MDSWRTPKIVQQLTLSAIDGNATGAELRERILNSPAFCKARAVGAQGVCEGPAVITTLACGE